MRVTPVCYASRWTARCAFVTLTRKTLHGFFHVDTPFAAHAHSSYFLGILANVESVAVALQDSKPMMRKTM